MALDHHDDSSVTPSIGGMTSSISRTVDVFRILHQRVSTLRAARGVQSVSFLTDFSESTKQIVTQWMQELRKTRMVHTENSKHRKLFV